MIARLTPRQVLPLGILSSDGLIAKIIAQDDICKYFALPIGQPVVVLEK
jgi:hypothetical protein